MNPLLLSQTTRQLKAADTKIEYLEQQIKSTASQSREEMEKMGRHVEQLKQEKELLNRMGKELEMAWTREKDRISMLNRERDDLARSSIISATKIADLQAQVENSKSLLAILQQEQQQRQTADDAATAEIATDPDPVLREALDNLMQAKAEALEKIGGLESRIRMDEDDICLLRGQLDALRRAKEDAEARVYDLQAALEAELSAHEASMLRVHDDCHQQVQERLARYEEEIIEMRTQVANIKAAKLSADRCVSDLETMVDRARLDGEAGHTKVAALEARIAELEALVLQQSQTQLTDANLSTINMNTNKDSDMNKMVASTPEPRMGAPSTPLTGSDAGTDVLTPAGLVAPPTTARKGAKVTVPDSPDTEPEHPTTPRARKGAWTATPPSAAPAKANHAMVAKMGSLGVGSEMDQLTEMQLEAVIASLEGQIVALEGELGRDRATAREIATRLGGMDALRSDYESRICDLENRLQLSMEDNATLHRFLCEVAEAMEKTASGEKTGGGERIGGEAARREREPVHVALL